MSQLSFGEFMMHLTGVIVPYLLAFGAGWSLGATTCSCKDADPWRRKR